MQQSLLHAIFLNRKKWKSSTENNNRSGDSQRKEHMTGQGLVAHKNDLFGKLFRFVLINKALIVRVWNQQTHFHLLQSNLCISLHTFIYRNMVEIYLVGLRACNSYNHIYCYFSLHEWRMAKMWVRLSACTRSLACSLTHPFTHKFLAYHSVCFSCGNKLITYL